MRLTLSYSGCAGNDRASCSGPDRGRQIARVVADDSEADLVLVDQPAAVNTASAWLLAYTDNPLPQSREKLAKLSEELRATTDQTRRDELLEAIQKKAAEDLTVIPVSQGVQPIVLGEGVSLAAQPYGPGFQLGLWSFRR